MSLPLTIRKNIRDSEPKLKEHLEKLMNITGKEWSFETDWAKLVAAEPNQSNKDSIGSTIQDECMKALVQNIEELCKNESSKEAFNEASANSKITFRNNPKLSTYWAILFQNGDLILEYRAFANIYEIGNFNIVAVIPTPGLPLPVRLNIEKSREEIDAALEKIGNVTGESDWSFEADYEKNIAPLDKSSQEHIGSTYAEALTNFAKLLESTLKDETVKESFNEATTQHKITIRLNDKAADYWTLQFANGEVIIEHKKGIYNLYTIGNFPLERLIPSPGGLSLVQRLNIQKSREAVDEELEKLKNATGEEWALEIDYEKNVKDIGVKEFQNSCDRIGETYQEAIHNLVENISRLVVEGDTVKEAFMEATPERKITIQVNDKAKDYWVIAIKNGGVVLEHKRSIANLYQIGNIDLKPLIPSPGGLSLVTRVNIEKNAERVAEYLQEIAQAVGTEDWTLEPDYEKAVKEMEPHQVNSVGDTYAEALENLKKNIVERMKSETIKEAFTEATPERRIIIRINDKCPDYWKFKFENGAIILEHKKSIANLYQIGNQDLAAALPVPGVLSLLARLNLQEHREKLDEALEKIKNATGEEYTFDEACIEEVYKKIPEIKQNIGSFMYDDVLPNVAKLIEQNMQDEMTKEAFNEVSTNHQITVRVDPKMNGYWQIKLENGDFVVYCRAYCNIYEIGNINLEKLL
eukprot:Phypoly_transcript_03651.p1 GENE.Phypoly_transcript_03651~~Phypoly_transcript_03651.p1  ORF type:complete len:695 (+),score=161.19 Phypoly_transcript_03651:270-2354(+)